MQKTYRFYMPVPRNEEESCMLCTSIMEIWWKLNIEFSVYLVNELNQHLKWMLTQDFIGHFEQYFCSTNDEEKWWQHFDSNRSLGYRWASMPRVRIPNHWLVYNWAGLQLSSL